MTDAMTERHDAAPFGKNHEEHAHFYVRDIMNRRITGDFESESVALASLKGNPDGHFSINNHQGKWCEVEVRGGERFVRYALMVEGAPAPFTNIDRKR